MIPHLGGHCRCGAVRYVCDTKPLWQGHCHCESCRRATASGFTSYFGMQDGHWRWTGVLPASDASSPGVMRSFCATCGTPMSYHSERYPHETHFFAATLDDPASYAPSAHYHSDEMLPWVHLADDLPRR